MCDSVCAKECVTVLSVVMITVLSNELASISETQSFECCQIAEYFVLRLICSNTVQ